MLSLIVCPLPPGTSIALTIDPIADPAPQAAADIDALKIVAPAHTPIALPAPSPEYIDPPIAFAYITFVAYMLAPIAVPCLATVPAIDEFVSTKLSATLLQ